MHVDPRELDRKVYIAKDAMEAAKYLETLMPAVAQKLRQLSIELEGSVNVIRGLIEADGTPS